MRETMAIALETVYLFFFCLLICFLCCLTGCTFNFTDTDGNSKTEVNQKAEQIPKLNPEESANLLKL